MADGIGSEFQSESFQERYRFVKADNSSHPFGLHLKVLHSLDFLLN